MIVFIKSHGRPDKQLTYSTLRKFGYTDKIIIVLDDEDSTYDDYKNKTFDADTSIIQFSKQHYVDYIDCGTNKPKRNVNLYAWCACEDFAKEMSLDSYIMADDDITGFRFRYLEDGHLRSTRITKNLDDIFIGIRNYMLNSDIAGACTGMPQMYLAGDYNTNLWKYRVIYQFVFRNANYDIDWVSEYEEDIVTSIKEANNGKFFTCLPIIQHDSVQLGKSEGGMKDMYDENKNRFRLAEYGHIFNPSCEIINQYKGKWITNIKRDYAFPRLISSSFKDIS